MLTIKNLHVRVEEKEILRGVDLTIKPGEVHAVMGPNGGGKSTLAQVLMGHPNYVVEIPRRQATNSRLTALDDSTDLKSLSVESSEGVVMKLDGEDLKEMSPDERAKKGLFLAFQYPVAIAGVSVQQFLWRAYQALWRDGGRKPVEGQVVFEKVLDFRREMERVAESLDIKPELLKRSINDGFSGGEKKRVEILQLLLLKPRLVVLDEIDSGLDVDAIKLVARGVRESLEQFQPGVLVITHYRRILDYLPVDRVHVLMGGKIVKSGGLELVEQLEKTGYGQFEKAV